MKLLTCALAGLALASAASAAFAPLDPQHVEAPGAQAAPASAPTTYRDEAGFRQRAKLVIETLAKEDLAKWRQGYFTGGDPGKYLTGPAMAKLLLDPNDAMARQYMNDNRSAKELYHFAIVNWARFYPLFSDALTEETKQTLANGVARAGMLYNDGGQGTENHVTMQITSGVVLPDYLGVKGQQDKAKAWLKSYVKNLYLYGQGEWDSSTYNVYDINGLLNIYDFSKDPECRLLAKAGLDWFAAAYAVKYVNGMHTGPKERGWTDGILHSGIDQAGWVWWGSSAAVTAEQVKDFRYALHVITSGWRPNQVLTNIAQRKLSKLPAEFRNSKPNYWTGLDKPAITPVGNQSQESLYMTPNYTLASMWYDPDTCTQLIRLQLGAKTKDGAISFTGSAPGSYNGSPKYTSGQGSHIVRPASPTNPDPLTTAIYVQYAQAGPAVICMADFPKDAKEQFTYFSTPVAYKKQGDWYVMQAGNTFVGVRPLTATVQEQVKLEKLTCLTFPGTQSGFILQTADTSRFKNVGAFGKALGKLKVDTSQWAEKMLVTCPTLDGRTLTMQYRKGEQRAAASINGTPVSFDNWGVYDGPYVSQKDGILTVNDGKQGFVVDFSGDLPVYKAWKR